MGQQALTVMGMDGAVDFQLGSLGLCVGFPALLGQHRAPGQLLRFVPCVNQDDITIISFTF
jgi:hypothetical protein